MIDDPWLGKLMVKKTDEKCEGVIRVIGRSALTDMYLVIFRTGKFKDKKLEMSPYQIQNNFRDLTEVERLLFDKM